MKKEELLKEIDELHPWWHYFELPDGTIIERDDPQGNNSKKHPDVKWSLTKPFIPKDLTGKRCLDIGSNSGYFSFKLAERGAEVLGVDSDPICIKQANLLKSLLLSPEKQARVEFKEMNFFDVEGEFDFILFMGVYYHLNEHENALPHLYSLLKIGGDLLFETGIEEKCRYSGSTNPYDASIFVPTDSYCREDIKKNYFHYTGGWEYNMKLAGQRRMYHLRK